MHWQHGFESPGTPRDVPVQPAAPWLVLGSASQAGLGPTVLTSILLQTFPAGNSSTYAGLQASSTRRRGDDRARQRVAAVIHVDARPAVAEDEADARVRAGSPRRDRLGERAPGRGVIRLSAAAVRLVRDLGDATRLRFVAPDDPPALMARRLRHAVGIEFDDGTCGGDHRATARARITRRYAGCSQRGQYRPLSR